MPVFDIFSKRQKRQQGEVPDVYQYETIPQELRVQVVHILRDVFGEPFRDFSGSWYGDALKAYEFIHKALCREYGKFTLGDSYDSDHEAVVNFLLQTKETEKAIDVIEFSF